MPVNLSIKNVPDEVARGLRNRAARNNRSLHQEMLEILKQAAKDQAEVTIDVLLADAQRKKPALDEAASKVLAAQDAEHDKTAKKFADLLGHRPRTRRIGRPRSGAAGGPAARPRPACAGRASRRREVDDHPDGPRRPGERHHEELGHHAHPHGLERLPAGVHGRLSIPAADVLGERTAPARSRGTGRRRG